MTYTPPTRVLCVVPITRHWALNQLFTSILGLRKPENCTLDILLYIDSNDPRIKSGVDYWIDELTSHGLQVDAKFTNRVAPSEVRLSARRERIVAVHKELAEIVSDYDVDYVFGVEDDTILPNYAFARMLRFARNHPEMGFIEGVQCGRHKYKMVGAWRVNDIETPTKVVTYPFIAVNREHSFIEAIDGGGFYCYLTPKRLFCEADYRVEAECLGVDMLYGLDLRRKGFKNYIDWSIICGHNDFGQLIEPGIGKPVVQMLYALENGAWNMTVREPKQ